MCIGFIDYGKAFDSMEHPDLFQALREIGINERYVCILEDSHGCNISYLFRTVMLYMGVRQGDTLSPKVFKATMETIFKNYLWMKEEYLNNEGGNTT